MWVSSIRCWLQDTKKPTSRGRPGPNQRPKRLCRPHLELLEGRLVPATFTVTTPLDVVADADGQLSLREAVTAANANPGADTIVVPAGVFRLALPGADNTNAAGDLDVSGSTLFQGAGAAATFVDGQQLDRVFDVLGTAAGSIEVTFQGLTVRNGLADGGGGGGIRVGNADLLVQDCVVTGNRTSGNGGGISNAAIPGTGNITLVRSTVNRDVADGDGGGLCVLGNGQGQGSVLTVSGSTIQRNLAGNGGGISAFQVNLTNSTVSGNAVNNIGGGISAVTANLTNCTVSGNAADNNSGGILATTVTLTNSTVSGNHATDVAGGIGANTATLINSTVSGNAAANDGGGISAGTVTLTNSTVSGNAAINAGGGGILATTATLTNSTVSGNAAGRLGGGISATTVTLTNSTVSGNAAGAEGGGILATSVTLLNVTVTDNSSRAGGGVFLRNAGTSSVRNSIIAANLVDSVGTGPDVSGTFTSGGHNLIGDGTGATGFTNGTNGDQVGTAVNPIDARLGLLANNGGPTLTHALLPDSPAIDLGDNTGVPTADQRGGAFLRTVGSAPDIGAFEVQPPAPPSTPPPMTPPSPVVEIQMKRVGRRTRVDVVVDKAVRRRFFPFGAFTGPVQVLQMDVNGDGLLDVMARATINGKKRTRTFIT
jgi:hypothetical protein